jgi:predicted transcriptional regulator of viral defense system/very-short-patch-repair endonuclease
MREEMRSHGELAKLAGRQYGVVSHSQLLRLGFSKSAVGRLCSAERLHRVHRGVYATGHADLSSHGRCAAAILACGRGAILSHASAGWLWGLFPRNPNRIDVIVPGGGRLRAGIVTHRVTSLVSEEWGRMDRLAVTSLARTLLDLAATGPERRLEDAIEQAERHGDLDLHAIDLLLRRRMGERGTAALSGAVEIYRDTAFKRSRAERLFLDLVLDAELPRPAMNVFVAGHEIDAYWEAERFAVEVDGWGTHRTRAAFESDPLRQENLKLAGIDSIRFTARRIEREPRVVGQRLARLLWRRRQELGQQS